MRRVARIEGRMLEARDDALAVERALEIRVAARALSVTLRTPGHDEELATGFLAGEGLIGGAADVAEVRVLPATCGDQPDVVDLTLAPRVKLDWTRFERHFAGTAACGLCGRAHLESLRAGLTPIDAGARFDPELLALLPRRVREVQEAFERTGGLHAAAWCDAGLVARVVREDVGRHNAVDKVAGWLLAHERYPANEGLLWVSGRAGAEIVLKAARARIPMLAAIGAASSLAVQLAEAARMTLVGFLRDGRMTVYCGEERLTVE